jgi:hypothetical protein
MNFDDLCEIEPRLQQLADEAERFADETVDDGNVCASAKWYGYGGYEATGIKERLVQLVGHERKPRGYVAPQLIPIPDSFVVMSDPRLTANMKAEGDAIHVAIAGLSEADAEKEKHMRSSAAYDLAYDHIYNLLPDCRGACACSCIMRALVG